MSSMCLRQTNPFFLMGLDDENSLHDITCHADRLESKSTTATSPDENSFAVETLSDFDRVEEEQEFASPDETLIFMDWDDTLFPSSELFERRGLSSRGGPASWDADGTLVEELQGWREALKDYIITACSLSMGPVIVTNSRRPWVTTCVERFAPDLLPFFDEDHGCVTVVYADEVPQRSSRTARKRAVMPVRYADAFQSYDFDEMQTKAKQAAMAKVAKEFYSRYPGQTWKNILSFGDMPFEHDALRDVTFNRKSPGNEHIRTKTVLTPEAPTIRMLILSLRIHSLLLPALVRLDTDIDLDLEHASDAWQAISHAFGMPRLGRALAHCSWSRMSELDGDEMETSLGEVSRVLQEFRLHAS